MNKMNLSSPRRVRRKADQLEKNQRREGQRISADRESLLDACSRKTTALKRQTKDVDVKTVADFVLVRP